MNKQNLLKIIDSISYLLIINATVFVLLFQNSASLLLLKISLISYAVAFAASIAFCVCRLVFAKGQQAETELFVSNKQRGWTWVRLILSIIIFSFVIFLFFVI